MNMTIPEATEAMHGLLIILMTEAVKTSEMLINLHQCTWHFNPKDSHLHTNCRENLKSYLKIKHFSD
jgi:hypothetical protein